MNLREAAQAALKSMRSFESGTNGLFEGEFAEEIAALEAALAEPVQEPVAWVCYGSSSDEKHAIDYQQEDIDAVPVGTMLYTHPPQRKPLTEEEIGNAANSVKWSQQYHVDFARAVEAAHGIIEIKIQGDKA